MGETETTAMGQPVKVFISYSHSCKALPDIKDRVFTFSNKLRDDGIDCKIDQYEMNPSEGWPSWCLRHIDKSDFVLCVCTEEYHHSFQGDAPAGKGQGVKFEGFCITQAFYASDSKNRTYLPIHFGDVCVDNIPMVLRGASRYNAECPNGYDALYRLLTNQPATPEPPLGKVRVLAPKGTPACGTAGMPSTDLLPPLPALARKTWFVPHQPNPFFTGREEELDRLHTMLGSAGRAAINQRQTSAISGLGGVGKTQTAVRYCYDHRDDYTAVLWLRAESEDTLTADISAVAREIGLPEAREQDQKKQRAAVQAWLRAQNGWLLVLDNVDSDAMARACLELLPTDLCGAVLITSRLDDLTELGVDSPVSMPTLPPEDSVTFLRHRTGSTALSAAEETAVAALAKELGYLPLALEQAAAYIKSTHCGFAAYLEAFRAQGAKLLERAGVRAADYKKTVGTTWAMSIEAVRAECPAAVELLQVCSMLAPEAFPFAVIRDGGEEMGETVAAFLEANGTLAVHELLAPLTRYSLVTLENDKETFSMHRLVQAVTRDSLIGDARKDMATKAVLALNAAFPSVKFNNWPLCEQLTPHALACREWIDTYALELEQAARLLNQVAYYFNKRARYGEAELLFRRALEIWEKALGPTHPDTATCLNNLAELLRAQGKLAEAEPLYRRTLEIIEKVLGPEHPDTATSLNNLALLLKTQGKLAEAEPLYRRALEIREEVLGPEHPDTATSLNNLAELLRAQGKLAEAEPFYRRSLAIREKVLGPEHPNTATGLNNLAGLLRAQGKPAEAEPLYRRALAIDEEVYGKDHPDVATDLNNLAMLLEDQGKLDEAEPLYRRALEIREKVLGPEHPTTCLTMGNYAVFLSKTDREDEALELFLRAMVGHLAYAARNGLPIPDDAD